MEYTHQSVRDYVEAKKRGDTAGADQILRDTCKRFVAYGVSGEEITELGRAANTLPTSHPA